MATRKQTEETPVEGFNPAAARVLTDESVPTKRGKPRRTYAEWTSEVQFVRENVGKATKYEGVPHASSLAQGIRKTFGVIAKVRDLQDDKSGTLYLEYPAVEVDGVLTPDDDAAQETIARLAR